VHAATAGRPLALLTRHCPSTRRARAQHQGLHTPPGRGTLPRAPDTCGASLSTCHRRNTVNARHCSYAGLCCLVVYCAAGCLQSIAPEVLCLACIRATRRVPP